MNYHTFIATFCWNHQAIVICARSTASALSIAKNYSKKTFDIDPIDNTVSILRVEPGKYVEV